MRYRAQVRGELAEDLAEQRRILEAKKELRQEMETEREQRLAEAAALSEEKRRLHEETEKQREEQHKWALEQQTLLQELVASQATIRAEASLLRQEAEKIASAAHEHEHDGHDHDSHGRLQYPPFVFFLQSCCEVLGCSIVCVDPAHGWMDGCCRPFTLGRGRAPSRRA